MYGMLLHVSWIVHVLQIWAARQLPGHAAAAAQEDDATTARGTQPPVWAPWQHRTFPHGREYCTCLTGGNFEIEGDMNFQFKKWNMLFQRQNLDLFIYSWTCTWQKINSFQKDILAVVTLSNNSEKKKKIKQFKYTDYFASINSWNKELSV